LLGSVALDSLRSAVPGPDVTLPVEKEDGVIPNTRHEFGKLFLALLQTQCLDVCLLIQIRPGFSWSSAKQLSEKAKHVFPLAPEQSTRASLNLSGARVPPAACPVEQDPPVP
jgi:hypothetical protein